MAINIKKIWKDYILPNAIWPVLAATWTGCVIAATYLTSGLSIWQKGGLIAIITFLLAWVIVLVVLLKRKPAPITTENIAAKSQEWLLASGYAVRVTNRDDAWFACEIAVGEHNMLVFRPRRGRQQLTIQSWYVLGGFREEFDRLTAQQRARIARDLKVELARFKISFQGLDDTLTRFSVHKSLPITPSLSHHDLIVAIAEIEMAGILIGEVILRGLGR